MKGVGYNQAAIPLAFQGNDGYEIRKRKVGRYVDLRFQAGKRYRGLVIMGYAADHQRPGITHGGAQGADQGTIPEIF